MPRKEKKFHFIYKTTNKVTGKYYIGMHSTDDLEDGYLGSGKRLRYSVNKYGKESHKREILEFFNTRQELAAREREVVDLDLIAKEECMNLRVGGEGGIGFISEEQQLHRSQCAVKARKLKEKTDLVWFEKYNQNRLAGLRKAFEEGRIPNYSDNYSWLGKNHSEETKKKLSETMKGRFTKENNSQFGSMWITNGVENRKIRKDSITPDGWYKGRT